MNRIFCIKMGSSSERNKICKKYLNPDRGKPGICLGFNEAHEEVITQAIDSELALGNDADETERLKCWQCVDDDIITTSKKKNKEIKPSAVTRARNTIRNVCMADETDIFFTFHNGFLWWCNPIGAPGKNNDFCNLIGTEPPECRQSDLIRYTSKWSNESIDGKRTLDEWKICGQLRRKQMVQGTMSELQDKDDINLFKWTIGSEKCDKLESFDTQLQALKSQLCEAVCLLAPADFEAFVDMVFTQSGLRRTGRSGSNMKAIDGEYQLPFNNIGLKASDKSEVPGKTIYVQIKAKLNESELKNAIESLYEFCPETKEATIVIPFHTWKNKKNNANAADEIQKKLDSINAEEEIIPSEWLQDIQFIGCEELVNMWLNAAGISWLRKTAYAAME